MKRLKSICLTILCGLLIVIAVPFTQVYAGRQGSAENVVTIAYNQALQMALSNALFVYDIDAQIRIMQMHHRDLRDEITRLEQGTARHNAIHTLRNELNELDDLLLIAMSQQMITQYSLELSMQNILGGLANIGEEGADAHLTHALQSVMAAMASMQGIGGDIAMMQMRRAAISEEIQNLQSETGLRNILREARNSLDELERQILRLQLYQEQAELALELLLRSIVVDMAEQATLIGILEAELALAEENQHRLALSYALGFISAHDLRTAEHSFTQNYAQLEELRRSYSISRQNLNYLLGLPLSHPTLISFNRQMSHIPQNLSVRIAETVSQAPSIRQLQLGLDSAMGARRVYTGNDRDIHISAYDRQRAVNNVANNNNNIAAIRSRIALQDAVDRAVLGQEQAMRTMEAALHRGYANLEGLIAQYAAMQRDLAQASAALEAAAVSFELGHITRFEVDAAQLAIPRIEHDIEKILNQKWILGFMLENPSLLQ